MTIRITSALTLMLFGAQAHAAETPKVWTTQAELGAIMTSGNTKGTSVTGKIDSKQELTQWNNEYSLGGYFKEDEIKLHPVYMKMIERGMEDVRNGHVLTEEEMDKMDEEWLN